MNVVPRSLTSLLCFAILIILPPLATAQPPTSFLITGTVVNRNTGVPVPRCHISPALAQNAGITSRRFTANQDGTDTDAHGHFSLSLPSPGRWSIRATARGFRNQAYDEHDGFFTSLVLTPVVPALDITFRLTPDAAITGYVTDEANEPVRQAQISLHLVQSSPGEGAPQIAAAVRGTAITDDRGFYELTNVAPGNYRLSVQAHPWYATASRPQRLQTTDPPPLDPSLDVVYPVTWFPGGSDPQTAQTLTFKGGESRQADFQLLPIPSVHLIIPYVQPTPVPGVPPRPAGFPQVEPLSPGRGMGYSSSISVGNGQIDVSGLAPGLYRVRIPSSQGQPDRVSMVQINAGSARTLDLNSASAGATVTLHFDGPPEASNTQVSFIDVDNPLNVFRTNGPGDRGMVGMGSGQDGPPPVRQRNKEAPRTIDLVPGRYRVYLNGTPNLSLTGLTAAGKNIAGREVSVPGGESTLTIHAASGRAAIHGIVTLANKPLAGAMVMLVPATLDEIGSITVTRLDQSNSDGSFDILQVIPGQYILIAIDHGWDVNTGDPSTLRHYLTQGIPLDLKPSSETRQNLNGQAP